MISFDKNKYNKLLKSYHRAKDSGVETFEFEGHEIVVGYAKYLLEYLETRLGSR